MTARPQPNAADALTACYPGKNRGKLLENNMSIRVITLVSALLLLAACGRSEPGRVQGGAAAGAASGATVGLVGGPVGVAAGAIIGGGAGAIAGATTTPNQVDLGKPVWKRQ